MEMLSSLRSESEVANSTELDNDGIAGERLFMRDLDRFGSFANFF